MNTKKRIGNLFSVRSIVYGVFMVGIMILPIKIFAIGQTTDPIVIKNALRGKEYQQTMTVVNTEKTDAKIGFSAEGQIGGWASFYKQGDLKTELIDIAMKPGEVRNVSVLFKVPSGTPNGSYKGYISAVKKSNDDSTVEGSGTSVSQKINREVTITVNDKELVAFEVSIIPETYDLQKGEMLNIRLIYDNRGNVSVTPQAQIKIKKDDLAVYNTIYPYPEGRPAVKPGAIYEIPAIEIPTGKFEKGNYVAEMVFLENGKTIAEKKFGFSVDMFDIGGAAGLAGGIDKNSAAQGIGLNNLLITLILAGFVIIGSLYAARSRLKAQKVKNNNEKDLL